MSNTPAGRKTIFQTILEPFTGKEPEKEPEDILLTISRQRLKGMESAFDGRFAEYERRLCKIEGEYGAAIGQYREEIERNRIEKKAALEAKDAEIQAHVEEKEVMAGELAEAQDMALKVQRTREQMPNVLDALGFSEEAKAKASLALSSPQARQMVEGLLEEHFPGMPITYDGLLGMAPVIVQFMAKLGEKPKQTGPQAATTQTNLATF